MLPIRHDAEWWTNVLLNALAERRAIWPGDDPRWERLFGNYTPPTAAGIEVDEDTALTFSAVFAAVRIISETIASLPLHVYRRVQPQGKERAPEHWLYPILHDAPHPGEMTSFAWREAAMAHVLLFGNSYSVIERFQMGTRANPIARLLLLNPARVTPMRDKTSTKIVYEYWGPEGEKTTYAAEQILHLHGLGFSGLMGYSVVSMARESLGLGLAAEKHGAATFGNGAYFGGFLKFPGEFKDEAARKRFRRDWNARHRGAKRAGTIPILEQGLEWVSASMSNEDAQFLETRKFQTTEVARWFRLPPHMLADLDKATFSNIEHQGIDFVTHSIRPWLRRFEADIHMQLLSDEERKTIFAEFLVDDLLRGDMKARMEAMTKGFQSGIYTLNEIRARENLNPIEGEGGDMHFVPLNMQTLDKALEEPEPEPEPEPAPDAEPEPEPEPEADDEQDSSEEMADGTRAKLVNALAPVFIAAARRIVTKESKRLRSAAEKYQAANRIADMPIWLDQFYNDHYGAVRTALESAAWAVARLAGVTDTERVADYLKSVSERYVVSAWDQSRTATVHAKDGIIVDAIHDLTDEWVTDEAIEQMGATEAAYAVEYFSRRNGHAVATTEN